MSLGGSDQSSEVKMSEAIGEVPVGLDAAMGRVTTSFNLCMVAK
jgi:hypothetical protein